MRAHRQHESRARPPHRHPPVQRRRRQRPRPIDERARRGRRLERGAHVGGVAQYGVDEGSLLGGGGVASRLRRRSDLQRGEHGAERGEPRLLEADAHHLPFENAATEERRMGGAWTARGGVLPSLRADATGRAMQMQAQAVLSLGGMRAWVACVPAAARAFAPMSCFCGLCTSRQPASHETSADTFRRHTYRGATTSRSTCRIPPLPPLPPPLPLPLPPPTAPPPFPRAMAASAARSDGWSRVGGGRAARKARR